MVGLVIALSGLKDWGLLALRLANAAVFWRHGTAKVKTAKGGFRLLGLAETLGSLAMLSGVLTELAALGLALVMVGAIYMKVAKWKTPFTAQNTTGWELDLTLLAINIALLTLGPGKFSLVAMLAGGAV